MTFFRWRWVIWFLFVVRVRVHWTVRLVVLQMTKVSDQVASNPTVQRNKNWMAGSFIANRPASDGDKFFPFPNSSTLMALRVIVILSHNRFSLSTSTCEMTCV